MGLLETITEHRQKWQQLLVLYFSQRESAPPPTLEATRKRIRKLYEDSLAEGVDLPAPAVRDPVFGGMIFSDVLAAFNTPGVADPEVKESDAEKRERKRTYWRMKAREHRTKMAKASGREYKPRPPYRKEGHPCWCQCGQLASFNSRYLPGHGARVISLLIRVERGRLRREGLPKFWLERLRWKRCGGECNGWIPTVDILGYPMSALGYYCLRKHSNPQQRAPNDEERHRPTKRPNSLKTVLKKSEARRAELEAANDGGSR